jgi:hypothetical protein
LTEREKSNIASRKSLVEQYNYLAKLVDADLQGYVRMQVYPRLAIAKDATVKLSEDLSYLEVTEAVKPVVTK